MFSQTHLRSRPGTPIVIAIAMAVSSFLSGVIAASAQDCPAPANWFPHEVTPKPDPNTFPVDSATDCDFHQWAWQTFLYITQNIAGTPRFLFYPTDTDLFPTEVESKPMSFATLNTRTTAPALRLKVRATKAKMGGVAEDAGSIFQAGTGGILVAQDGNPLFYSVHLDPVFYEFVESHGYDVYKTYTNANPNTVFPPGSLELKASWRIVPDKSPQSASFTTRAKVPTLSIGTNGSIVAGNPMRDVTVALVGLHVVGVVAHHPEFIWASFEQKSDAPALPKGVSPSSGTSVSASNFTFYKAGTVASNCNVQPSAYTLNASSQTLSPITQVFLQDRDGGGISNNIVAIDTLNKSVHTKLKSIDVWKNYDLIGGVWLLPDTLTNNMAPSGSQLKGSVLLCNATMETFVQGNSCFLCHTTTPTSTSGGLPIPAMDMNLSHVLTDGLVTREVARRKAARK